MRFENFFLIKNALSHVKFYTHKKNLKKILKKNHTYLRITSKAHIFIKKFLDLALLKTYY